MKPAHVGGSTLGPIEMHASDMTWQFAPDFDASRRALLERVVSFATIVANMLAEATVVSFNVCGGKVGILKHCCRPEFQLTLSPETADLFFNSPAGYRAQYLTDPDEGQKQNARLIGELTPRLVSYADAHPSKIHMTQDRIRFALSACSAKVWLPEASFAFNHDLIEEIVVPLWHRNALAALKAFANHNRPDPEQQEKAIWGLRASRASSIEVKGAFLSEENEEVVPRDKISRRSDIHLFGYA